MTNQQPKPLAERPLDLEIMKGRAGLAVYLNGHRIAGVRDNGIMSQVHTWQVAFSDLRAAAPQLATDLAAAHEQIARLREALGKIEALEPEEFVFPADWQDQIAACPECQGWAKHHPIQRGICDTHRRPIWNREAHDARERNAIGYRAKTIARNTLAETANG